MLGFRFKDLPIDGAGDLLRPEFQIPEIPIADNLCLFPGSFAHLDGSVLVLCRGALFDQCLQVAVLQLDLAAGFHQIDQKDRSNCHGQQIPD